MPHPNSEPDPLDPARKKPTAPKSLITWKGCLAWLAVLFVVYVLAIGPLFWIWYRQAIVGFGGWVGRLYMPLAYLCDAVPPLGDLINWYIRLWIV